MDQAIVDELHQLGMEKARFETQIVSASLTADEDLCTSTGIDRVEFILTVNPGQEMRSLVKVASGGELSSRLTRERSVWPQRKDDTHIPVRTQPLTPHTPTGVVGASRPSRAVFRTIAWWC